MREWRFGTSTDLLGTEHAPLGRLLKRVGAAVRVKRVNLRVQQAYRLVIGYERFADDQVGRIVT